MTDHILEIDWNQETGWNKPKISPYKPFQIDPANSTLHYALECFEGMKGYPHKNGKDITFFRPEKNMERLLNSFDKLAFPSFDTDELLKCITEFVRLEKDWIPRRDMHSLYIRPSGISMENTLGVKVATDVKLFTIISPVGPYYPQGFKPVSIYCALDAVRAWPNGNGDKKLGANYGPTIYHARKIQKLGYDQVLWLVNDFVSEVGVMNFFVLWQNEQGEKELITCPLDGTILPGVTRSSILELSKTWGDFKVTERKFTIHELVKAAKENRIIEAFGSGTAAVVAPVKLFHYNGTDFDIPINEDLQAGEFTSKLATEIVQIQTGLKEFKDWTVTI